MSFRADLAGNVYVRGEYRVQLWLATEITGAVMGGMVAGT